MLIRLFSTLLFLVTLNAFACSRAQGTFAVDGETWKFDYKLDAGREYVFPFGTFILKLTVTKQADKTHTVTYVIEEKEGMKIGLVSKGSERGLKTDLERNIFAKGEKARPHSIINIKLTDI